MAIGNNTQQVSVALAQASLPEGDPGDEPTLFEFVISRSIATDEPLKVVWELQSKLLDGADRADLADDQPRSEEATIEAGKTETSVFVEIKGDTMEEANEQFELVLDENSLPAGVTIGTGTATATIENDDTGSSEPIIGFDPPGVSVAQEEGSSGPTVFEYTLKRSGDLSEKSIALVQVTHGTTQETDFSGNDDGPYTVRFDTDQESASLEVKIKGEETVEEDETFELTITNVINGDPDENASTASGTILDDDTFVPPELSIGPPNVGQPEGDVGRTTFTFTVTRTGEDLSRDATAQWNVFPDGDNPAGPDDFAKGEYPSGTVVFAEEQTEPATIEVEVQGDNVVEVAEGFKVALSSASGANIGQAATATGTIEDDDAGAPVVAIVSVDEKEEGNDGSTPFLVTLSRTGDLTEETPFTLTVDDPGGSGDDFVNAQDFADGEPLPFVVAGSFPAVEETGEQTVTVPIDVAGDLAVEGNERFTVTVAVVQNGQIDPDDPASATGEGTIINDDLPPAVVSIEATGADQLEGNTGDAPATEFKFTVSRTGDDRQDAVVKWQGEPIGDNPADIGDFDVNLGQGLSGEVTIPAGQASADFSVKVLGDSEAEEDETFQITLTETSDGSLDPNLSSATGTIRNDDGPVVVSIEATEADKLEGNMGAEPATEFKFTVSHAGDNRQDVEVTWQGAQTGDDPADLGDFDVELGQGLSGTVTIPAGQNSAPLIVPVLGDTTVEADETFLIKLTGTSVGSLDPNLSSATGTIRDDDRIRGTENADIITPDGVSEGVTGGAPSDAEDVIDARGGNDIVDGGGGADIIEGGDDDDDLFGGSGDDTLDGGIGFDILSGGDDNDTLRGQDDDDSLAGGLGADTIIGGGGNDTLFDAGPDDTLEGGDGAVDTLEGGPGADTYVFRGDNGADTITDFANGEDLIDLSAYGLSGPGDFVIEQDPDNPADTVIYGYDNPENTRTGNTITLKNTTPGDLGPEDFILAEGYNVILGTENDDDITGEPALNVIKALGGNDIVNGNAINDVIDGGEGNDTIDGGAEDDTLVGGADDDTLNGGTGSDLLRGEGGADTLEGGLENDVLEGGTESDTFVFTVGHGADTITDFGNGSDLIDLSYYGLTGLDDFKIEEDPNNSANTLIFGYDNDENLKTSNNIKLENVDPLSLGADDFIFGGDVITGTEGDDIILIGGTSSGVTGGRPSDANNIINALEGHDRVEGGLGQDTIDGGEGDDILVGGIADPQEDDALDGGDTLLGGTGNDRLYGEQGNDILEGGADVDTLEGGGGEDTLDGGEGDDDLTGGADNDVFRFTGTTGNDRIFDFREGDKIDFSAYPDTTFEDLQIEPEFSILGETIRGFNPDSPDDTISLPALEARLDEDDFIFAGGNSIYISDVQIEEGNTGSPTEAVFTVSLSTPVDAPVTVDYATADGTAEAGTDYTAANGMLTFAPGDTVQEVRVPITGDGTVEPNESFFVNLSNPVNDVIADGQGVGTINDDDGSGDVPAETGADEVPDGTDGDDTLLGGKGDDVLSGLEGDDVLSGRSGDDTLDGGAGDDILAGGSGDDILDGGGDDDTLTGGSNNDVLEGGEGDDTLAGGSGDDQLNGGSGNDALIGGSGYDSFVYRAADGDSGHDTVRLFNADEDTLRFEEYGEHLDEFSDLDTNANGVLDNGDANVSIDTGDTVIDLGGQTDGASEGSLKLVGINGLEADDMSFS